MGWTGPMTYRQYLVWKAWLKEEWNNPSRSDYYAMSTALRIVQKFNKEASSVKLDDLKIPFGFKTVSLEPTEEVKPRDESWMKGRTPPPIMTKETIAEAQAAMSKSTWAQSIGAKK